MMDRCELERKEEWRKWVTVIPFINFKPEWQVKVIPPTVGAMVRFIVKKESREISVYLDCHDNLGCVGEPYWEMFPYEDDVKRFLLDEVDDLVESIEREFNANN